MEEVRKCRPRSAGRLTPAALKDLRSVYAEMAVPAHEQRAEAAALERRLSDLVNAAYALTSVEIYLLWDTAPSRIAAWNDIEPGVPGTWPMRRCSKQVFMHQSCDVGVNGTARCCRFPT